MSPRWKGKAAEAKALLEPMSSIVSRLQSSLIESDSHGLFSGCSVLLAAQPEQTELFNQACFGRPVVTAEKDKQWFQLSLEEALYLCSVLKCIKWRYMTSKKADFPYLFKAYSHLRMKNWVVRAGSQYGSDFHCTLRLCGSVAKTLLVLHISKKSHSAVCSSCLECYCVEERIVSRWNPEQSRENQTMVEKELCKSL
ncbi:tRNA-splicing endonuclease subunit sen2-2 [Phtheirospermum japonicum]|uniref:tRNA-splicing endonuclease subunit sen2-2 n=1 Tax=Phtheirospermum japonicum TaxID=374723 RepID=A0A830CGA6_9LAMI|nr:tRNA-splicing endonuclease subunit sen2-2 [Phtheirospermum japonicum]